MAGLLLSLRQTVCEEEKISGAERTGDGEFIWDTLNLKCLRAFGGGSGKAAGDMEERSRTKMQLGHICT